MAFTGMFNRPAADGGAHTNDLHPVAVRWVLGSLLLFAGMTVLHTWPLAMAPATWSRHDTGDAMLNEWIIGWIAHQLPRHPLHLFDANIFFPEPNTLAFSEHMFVQALMGAPLLWAGVSSLLVHNLLIMAGLTLTGWTMCLVMYRWTGDVWAAVVAGLLMAFNAHSLTRIANLQAMHVEFLPVAVYALDRLLVRPSATTAFILGIAVALQTLTSNYLLVMMAFAMVAAAFVRPSEWLGRQRRRTLALLVLAAGIVSVMLIPFLLPYLHAQRQQGLTRSLTAVAVYDGSVADYLTTGGRIHFGVWSARFWTKMRAALFPGIVAVLLSGVTVVAGLAWRDRRMRLWVAIGVAGFVLSFGTKLPGYELLYRAVPLLQGIRATVRFGYLALVAVAALAGFGLARLNRLDAMSQTRRATLGLLAALLVTVEAARLPLGYVHRYEVPPVYRTLALEHPGAVIELPLPAPPAFGKNAPYMLNSMIGWWPLVNGYSGFLPDSYLQRRIDLAQFPADESIAVLRQLNVRHVVIHREEFSRRWPDALERLDRARALHPIAAEGDVAIYRIDDENAR
jgi:hypothetical protein